MSELLVSGPVASTVVRRVVLLSTSVAVIWLSSCQHGAQVSRRPLTFG